MSQTILSVDGAHFRSNGERVAAARYPSLLCKLLHLATRILAIRRSCLFLLDHYACDASWSVFRLALRDPVASVREVALHGLSCERCRTEDLCVADVVTDLIDVLTSDPNAEIRHKAVAALARFLGRDGRARDAIARTASD